VSWQDAMDRSGIVVGNEIDIVIDVEAILETLDSSGTIRLMFDQFQMRTPT
jgi:hypothetical protein